VPVTVDDRFGPVTGWVEVADGVHVRRYDPFDVNCTVIAGATGSVLVDARTSLREGSELRRHVAELSVPPLTAIVVTHHHLDHVLGAGAFPGVPVWGSTGCREALRTAGLLQKEDWLTWLPDGQRPHLQQSPLVVPTRTVDRRATLDLGGRTVDLLVPGHGHTDHDLVVHVPDAGVLCAGDLVEVGGAPQFGDAHPYAWPTTLARLRELDAPIVVPGHGAPTDDGYVARQEAELSQVAELCRQVLGGHRSRATAARLSPYPDEFATALERAATT
jgi:glyoxylase-like metal-dependent hydrolase (beta-lactamase superfamily II)